MSNIPNIIGGVIALAAINRLLDTKPTGVTPTTAPKPLIKQGFVTGPAAGSQDFTLIKPMTQITPTQLQAFRPQTPEQAALTRERITAPSGTMEQARMQSDAIVQGKIKKFGTGVSLYDLLRRQQ